MKLLRFIPTIIATFCLILVFISCSEDNDNNKNVTKESFTVTNKEEKMPVWVHGKSDAKYILLAVHGGPGSDVLDFRNYKNGTGFKAIEDKFIHLDFISVADSSINLVIDNNNYNNININVIKTS